MDHDDLILRAIDALASETRLGIRGIHERLDALNGRTRKTENAIAVLEERTSGMVCAEHAATFAHLKEKIDAVASPSSGVDWRNGKVVAGGVVGLSGVLYAALDLAKTIVGLWK